MNREFEAAAVLVAWSLIVLGWANHAAAEAEAGAPPGASAVAEGAFITAEPAIVWRASGPRRGARDLQQYHGTFSPDGRLVGVVHPGGTVRLLDAADGSLIERVEPDAAERLSYSMAIANTGRVAVGRQGSMDVYDVADGGPIAVFPCAGPSCEPVSLAFSPDGSLLAFDEVTAFPERPNAVGSVRVVDLKFETPTRMKASAGLRTLAFGAGDSRFGAAPSGDGASGRGSGFRIWHSSDWELPRTMLGRGWTVGTVPADSAENPAALVAVYASGTQLVMRDFATDRLLWTAQLIAPRFAAGPAARSDLDRIELAPNGRFLVGYESPVSDDPVDDAAGAVVVRRAIDGAVVEVYDVPGVADVAIAPDSSTFMYTTGAGQTHTALVRVPTM